MHSQQLQPNIWHILLCTGFVTANYIMLLCNTTARNMNTFKWDLVTSQCNRLGIYVIDVRKHHKNKMGFSTSESKWAIKDVMDVKKTYPPVLIFMLV